MTAQGSALTRYRRALERRHVFGAEVAAKEMAFLSLRDALGLLALYATDAVAEVRPRGGTLARPTRTGNRRSPAERSPNSRPQRYWRSPVDPTRHCVR